MPCSAGTTCKLKHLTPTTLDSHPCRGECGGSLHGVCGGEADPDGGQAMNRICPKYADAKRVASSGKRKADAIGVDDRVSKKFASESRKRLTLGEKIEVVELLEQNACHSDIAKRYGCSARTVSKIARNKASIKSTAASGGFDVDAKSVRKGYFPEVDKLVLAAVDEARKQGTPVTNAAIMSFGQRAKSFLADGAKTGTDREKLNGFGASRKWAKNLIKRNGLVRRAGMAPMIDPRLCVTCSAPTNIAVIKYWGKDSIALNTPINSSASVTLCQDDLRAITTVAASKGFKKDQLWLNGTEEDITTNKRFQAVIRQVRALATDKKDEATGKMVVAAEDWSQYGIRIASRNTFPTAAGLASSAAGLACLTFSLSKLFNAEESFAGELSAIARQGSGSACRSLYGGFVKWQKGEREDARDSIAIQVADENYWPEIRALIMVVSAEKKDTSSTAGMSTSVETSPLLRFRANEVVEPRLVELEKAYLAKDFDTFGRITMQDSNQFHATCLDTYPPIFYMNDVSRSIVRIVHAYNAFHGEVRAAYTFDAGPNAVIYHLAGDSAELVALLLRLYPAPLSDGRTEYVNNAEVLREAEHADSELPEALYEACLKTGRTPTSGEVKMIYCTKAGGSPRVLDDSERMLDLETGEPKFPVADGNH